jgi:hypothetical protein
MPSKHISARPLTSLLEERQYKAVLFRNGTPLRLLRCSWSFLGYGVTAREGKPTTLFLWDVSVHQAVASHGGIGLISATGQPLAEASDVLSSFVFRSCWAS